MHPAPSIIAFTTLSGLGFGLLFWLGLDTTAPTGLVGFVFFAIAFALALGGLMASALHLGRKERAFKAFSQWKTSWLSREAWFAAAALGLMGIYATFLVFAGTQIHVLGWLGGMLSLATVGTTSMIYTQLKTVPRWNMPLTPALFVACALSGGALLSGRVTVATGLLVLLGAVQIAWWIIGDRRFAGSGTTIETATGLGSIGKPRAFEPPHTGTNYLMREMVFHVGRKHALKLRVLSLLFAVILPVILLHLPFVHVFGLLAVITHIGGMFISRWLFFAEAEHVVGLYYGQR